MLRLTFYNRLKEPLGDVRWVDQPDDPGNGSAAGTPKCVNLVRERMDLTGSDSFLETMKSMDKWTNGYVHCVLSEEKDDDG